MRAAGGLGIRNLLTGLFALLLLDSDLIPFGYVVILIPLLWFALRWTWLRWQPDAKAEDRTRRLIAGGIAGAAIVSAIVALKATHHFECTKEVRAREGTECVGEYVLVPGPDKGGAFIYGMVAIFAVWAGIHTDED